MFPQTTPSPPDASLDWDEYASTTARPGASLHPQPRDILLWHPEEDGPFLTEQGAPLPEVRVRYETYGPHPDRAEGRMLVFHALTGSAHVAGEYTPEVLKTLSPLEQAFGPMGWWDALIGPGKPLDTRRYFVLCANLVGSCYGSTGPLSPDPRTGRPYGPTFPSLTVRDLVRVHLRLLDALGVDRVMVMGGSLGGMLALEFALMAPERTEKAWIIAAPARHGPWARALNRLGKMAIHQNPAFRQGHYSPRKQPPGLALARGLAMMSYRSPQSFELRWGAEPFRGETYVMYQGEKFLRRFDANAYLVLLDVMDTHDVGRDRGAIPHVLARLASLRTLFVGIESDLLYPAWEIRQVAQWSQGEYVELRSPHGHDAFLIETEAMARILRDFLCWT